MIYQRKPPHNFAESKLYWIHVRLLKFLIYKNVRPENIGDVFYTLTLGSIQLSFHRIIARKISGNYLLQRYYLKQLMFADDIILIANNLQKGKRNASITRLSSLSTASWTVGLKMNYTNIRTIVKKPLYSRSTWLKSWNYLRNQPWMLKSKEKYN